jgi:hypothetical protein
MASMETNDIRSEVVTADGWRYTIHVHKRGKTWMASGYVGTEFLVGAGAKNPEAAVENWKRAYEQRIAKEN